MKAMDAPVLGTSETAIRDKLRLNHEKFHGMLDALEQGIESEPVELLLELARNAATFAWSAGCGIFSSARLEGLMFRLAERFPPEPVAYQKTDGAGPDRRRRVTMVITSVYGTGGHSRLASRWISLDRASRYTVVLTAQESPKLPQDFIDLEAAGLLDTVVLDLPGRYERILALRGLLAQCDSAVLLIHPNDMIPNVALAAMSEPPPVLFQDHASHMFWVGGAVSNLVLSETNTMIARRGIPPRHTAWNPLPLDYARLDMPPTFDARERYAIPRNVPLLVTCGSSFKYNEVDGISLAGLLTPVLAERSDIHLIVIGVGLDDMPHPPVWAPFMESFGARVRMVGRLDEEGLNACFKAADVYLDSTPFSSPTTLFEAAAVGLPVVRFAKREWAECEVSLDMEAIPRPHYIWADEDAYREDILRLLDEPDYRSWRGAFGRDAVRLMHGDATFLNAIASAFRRAERTPRMVLDPACDELVFDTRVTLLDTVLHWLQWQNKWEGDWKALVVARALVERGNWEDGAQRLLKLVAHETAHWEAYYLLSQFALRQGDHAAARDLHDHACLLAGRNL